MKTKRHIVTIAAALMSLLAITTSTAAPAETPIYRNPILHADYSDPDVIRVGDRYYMTASTFHFSPGLPILESRDLVHWTIIAHALDKLSFSPKYDLPGPLGFDDTSARARFNAEMGHRYSAGVWAPAIRYHNQRFYIYFATPSEGIFMVSAKKPQGPWSKPIMLIDKPNLEDPCPLWDDDGNAYLVHSIHGAGPLILHRMSADGTRVLDDGHVIVEDPKNLPTLEGPKFHKRNGYYYIFAPYGGVEKGPQAVLRSKNIDGPYEFRTVLAQGNTNVQAPHQGGYVETPDGKGWFAHFNSTGAYGRIVHLQPVQWENDWPIMGERINGSITGQPVMSHVMPNVGKRYQPVYPQTSDEFSSAQLGLQWEWNHNPNDTQWSLKARRGFMRLNAMPAENFLTARNTLTQLQFGSESQLTVRIDVSGVTKGQRAGLGMLQVQPNWIGMLKVDSGWMLTTASAGGETTHSQITKPIVQLRMNVKDEKVSYSYSVDEGQTFTSVGQPATMRFSWWKGARPALFSYMLDGSAQGYVDFDWVHVEQVAPARND